LLGMAMLSDMAFAQKADLSLYFEQPADHYLEALPLGNGHIGALVFGDPNQDRIVLNEKSLWSGGVHDTDREDAHLYLKPIQDLLLKGDNKAAQELLQEHFVSKGRGSGFGSGANDPYGSYQTLGNLRITWADTLSGYTDYSRTLNLEEALAVSRWTREDVEYVQEAFTSIADDVVVVMLSASQKGKISFSTSLDRRENAEVQGINEKEMLMTGQLPNADQPGMKFAALLKVIPQGGSSRLNGDRIKVENADACYLILTAATDYNIKDLHTRAGDPTQAVKKRMEALNIAHMKQFKQRHFDSFGEYFNRSSFTLAEDNKTVSALPTPVRLRKFAE